MLLESGQGLISLGNGLLEKSVCHGTPCSALHPRQHAPAKGVCAWSTSFPALNCGAGQLEL